MFRLIIFLIQQEPAINHALDLVYYSFLYSFPVLLLVGIITNISDYKGTAFSLSKQMLRTL